MRAPTCCEVNVAAGVAATTGLSILLDYLDWRCERASASNDRLQSGSRCSLLTQELHTSKQIGGKETISNSASDYPDPEKGCPEHSPPPLPPSS